jgi:hypothetical protein
MKRTQIIPQDKDASPSETPAESQKRIEQLEHKMSVADREKRELQRQIEELVRERDEARKAEQLKIASIAEQLQNQGAAKQIHMPEYGVWVAAPSEQLPNGGGDLLPLSNIQSEIQSKNALNTMKRVISAPNLQATIEQNVQPENRAINSTKRKSPESRNLAAGFCKEDPASARPARGTAENTKRQVPKTRERARSKPGPRKNSIGNRRRLVWTDGMRERFMLAVMQIGLAHHTSMRSLSAEVLSHPTFAKYLSKQKVVVYAKVARVVEVHLQVYTLIVQSLTRRKLVGALAKPGHSGVQESISHMRDASPEDIVQTLRLSVDEELHQVRVSIPSFQV